MAAATYEKKFNHYLKNWYNIIMDEVKEGKFSATLYVCDWDCDEGNVREVVSNALDELKEIFNGIKIKEGGDGYLCWYDVSWDFDGVIEAEKICAAEAAIEAPPKFISLSMAETLGIDSVQQPTVPYDVD